MTEQVYKTIRDPNNVASHVCLSVGLGGHVMLVVGTVLWTWGMGNQGQLGVPALPQPSPAWRRRATLGRYAAEWNLSHRRGGSSVDTGSQRDGESDVGLLLDDADDWGPGDTLDSVPTQTQSHTGHGSSRVSVSDTASTGLRTGRSGGGLASTRTGRLSTGRVDDSDGQTLATAVPVGVDARFRYLSHPTVVSTVRAAVGQTQ